MHESSVKDHLASRSQRNSENEGDHPYAGKTLPSAELFGIGDMHKLEEWLTSLEERDEPPTPEHKAFLETILRRLAVEARSEQARATQEEDGEPLFHMVHGVPGAGKSKLIQWLRESFQQVLD